MDRGAVALPRQLFHSRGGCVLSRRSVQRGRNGNPVAVPMSRDDIGDYLGLTTETVSRTFTQIKQGGSINLLPGGKVEMADRARLEDIAEGL